MEQINWPMNYNGRNRLNRKRVTKIPCEGCFLHLDRCICSLIPNLSLKTKISLIIHAAELKHTTNTGRLAIKALSNSEIRVRGFERTRLDLTDLLSPNYRTFLFYPSDDALELNENLISQCELPIQLLVPDGSWRQAFKVHSRHPELKDIPRVMISTPNTSTHFIRNETNEYGMATLQALALALGIIEGPDVKESLMKLYQAKLEQTLMSRGKKFNLLKI
jgi:DTW domain-containing protein